MITLKLQAKCQNVGKAVLEKDSQLLSKNFGLNIDPLHWYLTSWE